IESLPMRFAAVATDLLSGEAKVFDRGDLGFAVQASASVPGLLEPVRLGGRPYVDGSLSAPVPVDAARGLGAGRVVAVDVTFPPEQADLRDPFDALYQGFSILTRKLAMEERERADLLVDPPIPEHNDMEPATIKAIIDAGERAANDALPALAKLFSR
ncbi:MAG: patatin-like phospholipase family protein, partial [Woeseiaceae bacterium]